MVRRDWCLMTKRVSNKILDILLNRSSLKIEKETEIVDCQERIMEVLVNLKQELEKDQQDSSKVSDTKPLKRILAKYLITKGLNKAIEDYDKNNKSHHLNPYQQDQYA